MSDTEDGGVSDVEADNEFDDYDPLADQDDDKDDGASGSDDEGEDGAEGFEDDAGAAPGGEALPRRAKAPEKNKPRTSERRGLRDYQAACAVDTRWIIVVPSEERITSNVMTKAEMTRAIALRAEEISNNPSAFTDVGGLSRADDIARKELYDKRSPLILRRAVGQTPAGERIIEKWTVREMSYHPLN